MKKVLIKLAIILALSFIYLLISYFTGFYIPCLFHLLTGLYCPGCGVTRMLQSILKFDFYAAFRYNQLLFIMLPAIAFLVINSIICYIKKETPIYKMVNSKIWIITIVILIVYGILRNIYLPLAPQVIN